MKWFNWGNDGRDTSGGEMSEAMQAAVLLDEADAAQMDVLDEASYNPPLHFFTTRGGDGEVIVREAEDGGETILTVTSEGSDEQAGFLALLLGI